MTGASDTHIGPVRISFPQADLDVPQFTPTIRTFAERANTNIVHRSEFDRGRHFAAKETPDLLVGDLRTSFRRFR